MVTLDLFQQTVFILLVVLPIVLVSSWRLGRFVAGWKERRAIKKARAEYEKHRKSIGW